jgi:RNA polymerase sigma factor (sigma-70 family)
LTETSDEYILSLIRDKNSQNYGFNLLLQKYQEKVYWVVRHMLIDHDDTNDTVQDVFIKVWKNIHTFREASQLYTWIYRIATNETLTALKKKKNLFFLPIINVEKKLLESLTDDNFFNGDQILMKLQKAILELPPKQRLIFNMKYFNALKYDEIAEITGTSVGALKASYHLAVQRIEKYLTNH